MAIVKRIASEEYANEKALYEALKAVENIPQSDWAQNDSTAADYVKNRTHWVETGAVEIHNGTISFSEYPYADVLSSGSTNYKYDNIKLTTHPNAGSLPSEVNITIDGIKYICPLGGYISYSSDGALSEYKVAVGDSDYIACTVTYYGHNALIIFCTAGLINSQFLIEVDGDKYVTLDERFIPSTIARKSDITGTIIDDTLSLSGCAADAKTTGDAITLKPGRIVYGKTFTVDGVEVIAERGAEIFNGNGNIATGFNSHAEGGQTIASEPYSHAEGYKTVASGGWCHAEGDSTIASGVCSHAEGNDTTASGRCSHAEGSFTIASGECSHAEGKCNIEDTENKYAHIVGNGKLNTTRSNAHTLDWDGNAWFAGNVYIGSTSGTNKDDGSKKLATEEYVNNAITGTSSNTSAIINVTSLPTENIREDVFYRVITGTFIINKTPRNGWICHTVEGLPEIGEPVTTTMTDIEAYYNAVDGIVYGYVNDALSSMAGVSVGWYTFDILAPAFNTPWGGVITDISEGSTSDTWYLLLEYVIYSYKDSWKNDKKIGYEGTSLGDEIFNDLTNEASGNYSHAEGCGTSATYFASHAEGQSTTASGQSSHAEGYNTTASGSVSHAEGQFTTASGNNSHAEGWHTTASGNHSHAEGYNTTASGYYSHAEGYNTTASGYYSHAEGYNTTASGNYQHVHGKYNIADLAEGDAKYVHIVGNGTSDTARSNAHTLDWEGNGWFKGDVYVGSTSGTNKDDGSKKLATEEYADNKVVGLATETFVTNKISEAQLGGGGNVDLSGYVSKDDVIDVAHGGTGKTTHTANAVLTGNGTSAVKNVATASGALYATAANGAPKFGVLPYAQGGTGKALGDVPNYAIMRNAGDGDYMWYIATGNGALYATAENGSPKFGTLPIKQGGTGATSESAARSKLGTNMKLLWTNAAPASTFASFTPMTTSTTNKLAEKPGNFTAIMVWYRTHKSNEIYVSDIIPVGLGSGTDHDNVKQVTECQAAANDKWCRRYCFVSSTSITFGTGGYRSAVGNNWTVDSTYMIPVRIYGIR